MSMEGLREGAQNINNRQGGGGSKRNSYFARWKPPQMYPGIQRYLAAPPNEESITEVAEPVVIIKGAYPDLLAQNPGEPQEAYHFQVHTAQLWIQPDKPGQQGFKTWRDIVCSAGPDRHNPQPCLGCYNVDHGKKDAKAKDQWCFNIAHLGWYHNSPLVRDGQVVFKQNSQEPVMIKNECLSYKMENVLHGRAQNAPKGSLKRAFKMCEGCNQRHPHIFGDHRTLQLGFKHLKSLFAIDEELGKKCANCNTFMLRMAMNCGNEQCNARIVDLATAGWTIDQIEMFAKQDHQCQYCGKTGRPYSEYKCGFDSNYLPIVGGGCQGGVEPKKNSIFDMVLWLQREGESTESEIVVKKVEPISQFRTQDGRSLTEHLPEIVKSPFDLAEMYKPESLDEQAKTWNTQNPYAAPQQQYQQYGGPPQQGGYGAAPQAPQGYGPFPGPQAPQGFPGAPAPAAGPGGQPAPQYPNMPMPGRPNYGK
jgi:hypothetical protein